MDAWSGSCLKNCRAFLGSVMFDLRANSYFWDLCCSLLSCSAYSVDI